MIVVALDDVLVASNFPVEQAFALLRQYPLRLFDLIAWAARGRRHLRQRLDGATSLSVSELPYRRDLLEWLKQRRAAGASLVLAAADAPRLARLVADHLGIFDQVVADPEAVAGERALARPARGKMRDFEYVGHSRADILAWRPARAIHLVNPTRGLAGSVGAVAPVGKVFEDREPYFRTLAKALRCHQWVKNLLLFVPLLASHSLTNVALLRDTLIAFVAFCACASSVYLLNDLLDLPDDRRHPSKRNRPLASGTFPAVDALLLIPLLLAAAASLAFWLLPRQFLLALGVYYVLTLAYSLGLKRIVMLDVLTLAMLYTVRVIAGAIASAQVATFWLLAFCVFIFLSLAFLKRYTELWQVLQKDGPEQSYGRGYQPADFELLASLGGAAGYISVLVLALYINDASSAALYHSQKWMWPACLLLLFWLSRAWLLAHRGQMPDDPIVFAFRDRVSRWTGVAFVAVFVIAAL